MPIYETVLILRPVLSEQEVGDFVEKTKQSIHGDGGEIVSHEIWGRRKLTHMISRSREGIYAYFKYKASPELLKKLNHGFRITESILRDMTVVALERKLRDKKVKKATSVAAA
jgi:small subunit ribosomal protein S6